MPFVRIPDVSEYERLHIKPLGLFGPDAVPGLFRPGRHRPLCPEAQRQQGAEQDKYVLD